MGSLTFQCAHYIASSEEVSEGPTGIGGRVRLPLRLVD